MWVAYREPNMSKRLSYLTNRLTQGLTTKLHAYGLAIGTAVWMSTTIRHQLNGIEQKASILELKDEAKQRESFGMEIVLFKSEKVAAVSEKKARYTPNVQYVKKPNTARERSQKKVAETAETSVQTSTTVPVIEPEIEVKMPD